MDYGVAEDLRVIGSASSSSVT